LFETINRFTNIWKRCFSKASAATTTVKDVS